ncbi:MFS transporter [Mycobacteroides franklinii]|uniref:MFS transporter n=1 Tax=Mycobacteroides franklinii TaxID=948102 RepID=UPI0009929393|nr:MFS transporter [Mycobacteroides franklinii]
MNAQTPAAQHGSVTAELTRRYGLLYALLFVFGAEMYLVAPLLPTLGTEYGVTTSTAAALVTVYVAVQAIAGPFQGLAYPVLGARTLIVAGALVFAAGNLAAAFSTNFGILLLSRAVAGLGVSLAGPAIWSWIAETAPDTFRSTAIGAGMGGFAVGQVCGVPLGALVASQFGWRWSFGVMALVAVAAATVLWRALRHAHRPAQAVAPPSNQLAHLFRAWRPGPVPWTLLITFGFHAANLGAYTYLSAVLAARYHLDVAQLGYIGALSGGGMFLGSLAGGRILDRVRARGGSEYLVLPIWLAVTAISISAVFTSHTLWISLVLIPVWFFAAGAFDTNQQTLIAGSSPGFTAVALSWNLSVLYAATAFGVWIMGLGASRPTSVVTTSGGLLLASLIVAVIVGVSGRRRAAASAAPALIAAVSMVIAALHAGPQTGSSSPTPVRCSVHTTVTICVGDYDTQIRSHPNLKDIPGLPAKPTTKTKPTVVEPSG